MILSRASTALPITAVALLAIAAPCFALPSFTTAVQQGNIQSSLVVEASGIVASRANPNVLWTHNDSGDSARVFAMTTAGANLGTYSISGAGAVDWEDIDVGPGPVAGQQYLYIGDIGDNGLSRSSVSIYRVPEPTVSDLQTPSNTIVLGAVRLILVYPDARRNAESMFVDPATRDIYIISKENNLNRVYRAPYPQSTTGTNTLQLMTTFSTGATLLTAADISPDGNEILVRTYFSGDIFVRPPGGSITDAFNTAPITIPLASETQGEAIGFDPNGRGYFTTSEGNSQPIYYFNRTGSPPGTMYWDNDGVATGTYAATGAGMGGTGTWNATARKWYTGGAEVAWSANNDAVFAGTAGTVTLDTTQQANNASFKTDGYILTAGALHLTGPTINVDAGVTASINSGIKGSAGLTKIGSGTLRLGSANTYTGGTTIKSGTLFVLNSSGSGTGDGTVNVSAGARLAGTGAVGGDVMNGGVITPGSSVGALHISGSYTQAEAGELQIELASAGSFDALAIGGSASLAGILSLSLVGGFMPAAGSTFTVLTASSLAGSSFSTAVLPSLAGDRAWFVNYGATSVSLFVTLPGDFTGNGVVDAADYVVWRDGLGTKFTQADYNVWRSHFGQSVGANSSLGAVPEPATASAFGRMLILFIAARRTFRLGSRLA
jgi:autotransporter-associated beta strand protein